MAKQKKNWKPEYKYESISGTFTDYRGKEREFTMVAVSVPMDNEDAVVVKPVEFMNHYEIPAKNILNEETGQIEYVPAKVEDFMDVEEVELADVAKMLTIGVAVRCIRDTNLNIGTRIAYGKAVTLMNHTLYVSHSGMINTKMVKALLEQEAEHFKKDPGSYITGYNADRDRFLKTGQIAEAEMTDEEYAAHMSKTKKTAENEKKVEKTVTAVPKTISFKDKL